MAEQISTPPSILRRRQVETRTGLSRSTIYSKLKFNPKRPGDFDPDFPPPVTLGTRSVGWIESEIGAWINAQIEKSRKADEIRRKRIAALRSAPAPQPE